jgi:hypothetical protein
MTSPALGAPPVGKAVVLHVGGRQIPALVVEDRGPLGVGGERVVRIRVDSAEGEEPDEFEVRVSALTW